MIPEDESNLFPNGTNDDPECEKLYRPYSPRGRSGISISWFRTSSPLWSHYLVFVTSSLLWGCILLLILQNPSRFGAPNEFFKATELHGNLTSHSRFTNCGSSASEAKALGCRYDILSNHWVPSACMDQESVVEYQSDGSWFGFANENRTGPLTIDVMGETPLYYTSVRDHIVHCAMLWRKQYRAFFDGRDSLDSVIVDRKHTMHCSQYLINMTEVGTNFWDEPLEVYVGYAGCHTRN